MQYPLNFLQINVHVHNCSESNDRSVLSFVRFVPNLLQKSLIIYSIIDLFLMHKVTFSRYIPHNFIAIFHTYQKVFIIHV